MNRSRKVVAGAIGCTLLLGLVLVGLYLLPKVRQRFGGSADNAQRRSVVTPYIDPISLVRPGPIAIEADIENDSGGLATQMSVSIVVTAPDDARAIQLSQDPTFADASWQPVQDRFEFPVSNTGYQTVFVRFLAQDPDPGPVSVAGIVVDPTYEAATSSAAGEHRPSWVRPLTTSELVVRIEAGRLVYGAQEAYNLDEVIDGDRLITVGNREAVERDGQTYGFAVSKRRDAIKRPDQLIGRPLAIDDVVAGSWTITNSEDSTQTITPSSVRYIARPTGGGIDQDQARIFPVVYDLVLALPSPVSENQTYLVSGPQLEPVDFTFIPDETVSPAIRTNQVGYAPNDQTKVAYLSGWFDGLGASVDDVTFDNDEPAFRVVNIDDGVVAYRGTGRLRKTDDELGNGDLTGAKVTELEFPEVTSPGRYRVCVDQVGCSYDFAIKPYLWDELAAQVSRAMYHQRSGTELGMPFTPIARPRPYHRDEDVGVTASDYSLAEAQTETNNTDFAKLANQSNGTLIPQAWGGHFDAGDWDRRAQHLWYARIAAEMVLQFPDAFNDLELNIPESGDQTPDVLDEALWTVDLFQRMQRDDGAISGGIEASEHPPPFSSSWSDDLAVYAYEPDAFSSYLYAGVAAEVSHALTVYDPVRAGEMLVSAEAAMLWAESQSDEGGWPDDTGIGAKTAQQQNVAAAGLLLATGKQQWHDVFVDTADYLGGAAPFMSCHAHYECDGGWMYLLADPAATDPDIRAELERRFVESADGLLAVANGTGYGWSPENPFVPLIWGLGAGGAPHTSGFMKAHFLTGDDKYRSATLRAASLTLGANPMNRSMITGLGHEPPSHPLIVDVVNGGLPLWSGTPVYGYHSLVTGDDDWVTDEILVPAGAVPNPNDLPYLWQWYDVVPVAQFNEFTVHQSHADALATFASLAATSKRDRP